MESVLHIKDLKIGFKTDDGFVQAVDGLNLSIDKGKTLGLVGESGCGKSVTSLAAMRLLPEKTHLSGEINFMGEDLLQKKESELEKIRGAKISMIFQDPMTSLNPVLTVGEQIKEVIRYHKGGTKKEIHERTLELLELVKIPEGERRMNEYPHQLSGGLRQRIMIAIALACDPELLIADEPTTALDVSVQAQILTLIKELQEKLNTSVLMISHDLGVIAQVADDVAVMYAGQIVELASTKELFALPKHPYTQGLIRTIPRIDQHQAELEEIPGMVPELSRTFKSCRFHDRCPKAIEPCRENNIDLIDVDQSQVRCLLYAE